MKHFGLLWTTFLLSIGLQFGLDFRYARIFHAPMGYQAAFYTEQFGSDTQRPPPSPSPPPELNDSRTRHHPSCSRRPALLPRTRTEIGIIPAAALGTVLRSAGGRRRQFSDSSHWETQLTTRDIVYQG